MDSKNVFLKYGLILSGATIAYSLIINATSYNLENWASMLSFIFVPIFLFIAIKKGQIAKNNFSFGSSFGTGFKTTLVAAILIPIFTFVYISYINPDFIQLVLEKIENDLYARNFSEEQIEAAIDMQKMFMTPGIMTFFNFISYIFVGSIVSLIIAAIVKKSEEKVEY